MKLNKNKNIFIIFIFIFNLFFISVYIKTHYVIIDNEMYKNDITHIQASLTLTNINEINKCDEIEDMILEYGNENSLTKLKNFPNLKEFSLYYSKISNTDCKKISSFNNLNYLKIYSSTVNLNQLNNNTLFFIGLMDNDIINLKSLSECCSLKKLVIIDSTVSDNCIVTENNNYVMKNSSVFSYFDCVENLTLYVGKIEDISGILDMESLKEFTVNKDSLSREDVKLLEDKGISITYYNENK